MTRYWLTTLPMVGLLAAVSGCSANFGDQLRAHRECISEAQINPEKVESCLQHTNGHRENIDACLNNSAVAERRIELLNQCVDARVHYY